VNYNKQLNSELNLTILKTRHQSWESVLNSKACM